MSWPGKVRRHGGYWLAAAFLGGLALSSEAVAQEFPEPTDQNYTLDLYQGNAIGSARIVGMGGVSAATAEGSSGALTNPAAAGVRLTTANDTWNWDWHLVTQSPGLSNDTDNNGIKDADVSYQPNFSLGFVLQYKDWGLGITAITQSVQDSFSDMLETPTITTVTSKADVGKFSLAHYILDSQVVLGVGLRVIGFSVESETRVGNQSDTVTLAEISGASFESGALWKPNGQSFRVGGTISLPANADDIEVDNCDPLDCDGYILPERIKAPWVASIGIAGRLAPTPWNRKVKTEWRDERALLWGVDAVITGKTHQGFGLEAFGQKQLQPSGRKTSVSLRGGVEYEWFPGRLRVRGGSYFEPSRFKDPDNNNIPGRVHLTLGFDWNFWRFSFWDDNYRAQLSTWADAAEDFGVTGISVGFWH